MKTSSPSTVVSQTLPSGVVARVHWPKLGIVLTTSLLFGVVGAVLQLFGTVPTRYTWQAPFDILFGVISRPYFPSLLIVAWTLGILRLKEWAIRPSLSQDAPWIQPWKQTRRLAETAAFTLAVVALDAWIFPHHLWLDRLVLAIGAAILSMRLREPAAMRSAAANLLWTTAVFTLVSFGYTAVKAALFVSRDSQDPTLIQLETALWGEPFHVKVVRFFKDIPDAPAFFDEVYFSFFEHMLLTSALLSGMRQHTKRNQFVAALVFCYAIGAPAYFFLPTVGPAFVTPELFQFLEDGASRTVVIEQMLLRNTGLSLDGNAPTLHTFGYLASMPSLHVAHELVMVFYSRDSKPAFVAAALFAGVTFLSTLFLGWHYAVDGVGGALVAALAVWLASRWKQQLTVPFLKRPDAPLS